MSQYAGKVMWFNNAKGFGFLTRENEPDVFVHYTAIVEEGFKFLTEGEEVSFDIIQGVKGPQADHVRRVSRVASPAHANDRPRNQPPPTIDGPIPSQMPNQVQAHLLQEVPATAADHPTFLGL